MRAADDFAEAGAFRVLGAERQRVPFVFSSPHSGRFYPSRFLAMSRLDPHTIRKSEDSFVEELFSGAVHLGAPMIAANFPRAYLDVNREPWELDPRMFVEPLPPFVNQRSVRVAGGLGTVPRLVGEGMDIYSGKLPLGEAISRIETVYKPYHEALKQLMAATHARFGFAVLVDCHSMPASGRAGETGSHPDFILGDRFGMSAAPALVDAARLLLSARGYSVAHNKPYAGGFITEHYGRPARGFHALQIEVSRGLYMDETSLRKNEGFDALAEDLADFIAGFIETAYEHFIPPLAAE